MLNRGKAVFISVMGSTSLAPERATELLCATLQQPRKHKEKREVIFFSFGQGSLDTASFIIPILPLPVHKGL